MAGLARKLAPEIGAGQSEIMTTTASTNDGCTHIYNVIRLLGE
jgi:hypothetical protein